MARGPSGVLIRIPLLSLIEQTMNDTIERLLGHRSIRRFTDEPVSDDVIRTLVACGQAAATSSHLQATTVVQVQTVATRERIAEIAGGQSWVVNAGAFLVWCADLKRASDACAAAGGAFEPGMTEHFIIATVDVALAAQNAVVAAESLGLGICYIGGIRNDAAAVSALLELPNQVYPVFGLCLGTPARDPEIKPRLPLDAVLMQERYDDSRAAGHVAAFDRTMDDYYAARSSNTKQSDWSQAMRALVGKESRPHMQGFLNEQGFMTR